MAKIPRLQPYFLAKLGSVSSLFNLQSKSINFNFGHFSLIYVQNTKAIALHFGQNWLIFITFQSAIKINQFSISVISRSCMAKIPRLQPYFLAKIGSFSSLFQSAIKINQFQFRSFLAHFWPKYQGYSLTFWPKLAHFHHFSICNQNQSISNLVIFEQHTKAIALLFGQKCLIFITFQSVIKINQFHFRSFLAHLWPKYQGYSLTFWPKLGSFSSLFNLQSKSINFNFGHFLLIFGQYTKAIALHFGQNWLIFITFQAVIKINQFQFGSFSRSFMAKIPRLQHYFMAKIGSFSSLFNLQSKSINFNFGHFSLIYGQNTKAIALFFDQKLAHFHHLSICKSKSINFNFGHFSLIYGQNTKAIALHFGQNWLIFITFQSAIKINQFQFRSFLAHLWPKYQGYSPTFWPILAHFHHFSICNQNQSISISVISRSFMAKIPRLQPYILAKIGSFSSLFNLQSKSINFNFGHFSLIFGQNTKAISLTFWPKLAHFHHFSICNQNQSISNLVIFEQHTKAIALLFGQKCLIFITFQSVIKINQFQFRSFLAHLWPKYQGYSLTFWPKLAHFHHFSICNQNQSISISVISCSFLANIPRLQPYILAKIGSFSSLFNL